MRILSSFGYLFLAGSVYFTATSACTADATDEIVIGILAHRGEEAAEARWRKTIAYLQEAGNGSSVRATMLTLAGTKASLDRSELDFLITNPGHFSTLAESHGLSPIASLRTDRAGQPRTGNRYGAVIFTRNANEAIHNIADLSGKSFAAVAPDAFGGFLMAAHALAVNGVDPWNDLSEIRYFGFPQDRIVEAVLNGEVDAGTVRTGLLESMAKDGRLPKKAIRILNPQRIPDFELALSTDVFPEWVFSATPKSDERIRRRYAVALLSMEETHPAAVAGRYSGWTTFVNSPSIDGALELLNRRQMGAHSVRSGLLQYFAVAVAALVAVGFVLGALFLPGRRRRAGPSPAENSAASEIRSDEVRLTHREREVLCFIENGRTTKEIARELGISPKTVEYHRSHLMQKFEANNVAELVHKARLPGLAGQVPAAVPTPAD